MAFADTLDPFTHIYRMAGGEVLDGFIDKSTYADGFSMLVVIQSTGTINHLAATSAGQRSIVLRGAGATFTGSTRPRVISLIYGQNGGNFFWVQPE